MKKLNPLKIIKSKARLALPDEDEYLFRLGVALYGFNSINSFVTEILCHIDRKIKRTDLLAKESGKIIDTFNIIKKSANYKNLSLIHMPMEEAMKDFENLKNERNDIIHSYPITNKIGQQILHRRLDKKGKYFEVDNTFLESFISRLHNVSSLLYKVRDIVRPDL